MMLVVCDGSFGFSGAAKRIIYMLTGAQQCKSTRQVSLIILFMNLYE